MTKMEQVPKYTTMVDKDGKSWVRRQDFFPLPIGGAEGGVGSHAKGRKKDDDTE